jgi:membrane protein
MSRISRRSVKGLKPYTALELREETTIPIRFVNDLLYELIDAGLLLEITSDEKGEESRFMPAEDTSNLSLGVMVDRLESRGQWKIDLDVSNLFQDEWAKAVALRSNYLRNAREIALKDL